MEMSIAVVCGLLAVFAATPLSAANLRDDVEGYRIAHESQIVGQTRRTHAYQERARRTLRGSPQLRTRLQSAAERSEVSIRRQLSPGIGDTGAGSSAI